MEHTEISSTDAPDSHETNVARSEAMSERVSKLVDVMVRMPQADCPVRHHFAPGIYAREITIPKGVTLVGAVHRTENLAILSKGRMRIVAGDGTREIEAPAIVRVVPGVANAAYAIEECVWTNFFPTEETDTDKLVELLTFSKASELLGGADNKQLAMSGRDDRRMLE